VRRRGAELGAFAHASLEIAVRERVARLFAHASASIAGIRSADPTFTY
jgi:hypothetical protein